METSLTTGGTARVLLRFAIPLFIGTLFQQIYNIADSVVVGNFIGSSALAAVGTSGVIMNMISSAGMGLATGCSVMISQYVGAGRQRKTKCAIYSALLCFLVLGLIASVLGILFMKPLLQLLSTPKDMMEYALPYLRIIFCGILFVMLYHILQQVSVAIGDSKTPMWMLFIASVINIALDLLFTLCFDMGVAGVAFATILAQGFAALACYWKIRSYLRTLDEGHPAVFDAKLLKKMLRLGVPALLQNLISSSGMIAVQGLLNGLGSTTVAAYTAANKIDGIAMSPMVALGNAIATFTAQNMGARQIPRVRQGLRFVNFFAFALCIALGGVIFFNRDALLSLFIEGNHQQELLAIGSEYLHVAIFSYYMMALMFLSTGLLRGCGDVHTVFICAVLDLGGRVAFAYLFIGVLSRYALWLAYPFGWLLATLWSYRRYASNRWQSIQLLQEEGA